MGTISNEVNSLQIEPLQKMEHTITYFDEM
jgi:hypothetical protein